MTHDEWEKIHTVRITVKLNHNTESDIIQYLDGKNKQRAIKDAIRTQMKEKSLPG